MNAVRMWMAVIKYVLIHLDHMYVVAALVTDLLWIVEFAMVTCVHLSVRISYVCHKQILMNVLRKFTDVSTTAAIQMALMPVVVLSAIALTVMGILAMVYTPWCLRHVY